MTRVGESGCGEMAQARNAHERTASREGAIVNRCERLARVTAECRRLRAEAAGARCVPDRRIT